MSVQISRLTERYHKSWDEYVKAKQASVYHDTRWIALIKKVLEEIKQNNMILVPMCPFVAMYIKRHPEWKSLVLKGINIS